MYVYMPQGVVVGDPMGLPPESAHLLVDGEPVGGWVMGLREPYTTEATKEACGYFLVAETSPPTVAVNERAEWTIEVVDGRPVQVWTVRQETAEETADRIEDENRDALRAQIESNIATLLATVTALNEITSRTNNNINANPAVAIKDVVREIKTVARQVIRMARVQVQALDSADSGS